MVSTKLQLVIYYIVRSGLGRIDCSKSGLATNVGHHNISYGNDKLVENILMELLNHKIPIAIVIKVRYPKTR